MHEFWREDRHLHINEKELEAGMQTVAALAKPGSTVHLMVDNSVTYWYLKKQGGKLNHFNARLRPFLQFCAFQKINLIPLLVKSAEMPADAISRWLYDRNDYTLCDRVFQKGLALLSHFVKPKWDLFASPGNFKLPLWASRYPHWGASLVDTLSADLKHIAQAYANPPWPLIPAFLHKLRMNPQMACIVVLPLRDSEWWWPLAMQLQHPLAPILRVSPRWGLFRNCHAEPMPPPRWHLALLTLSSRHWLSGVCVPLKFKDI